MTFQILRRKIKEYYLRSTKLIVGSSLQAILNKVQYHKHWFTYSKFKIHDQHSVHQCHAEWFSMGHARSSAENLNISRSAGPRWIFSSKTFREFIFWFQFFNCSISWTLRMFYEHLKFNCHGPKFESAMTLHLDFCWELIRAGFAPSCLNLSVDKRKTKTHHRIQRTDKKTNENFWIVLGHDFSNFAPERGTVLVEKYQVEGWTGSTNHIRPIEMSHALVHVFKLQNSPPTFHAPAPCRITTHESCTRPRWTFECCAQRRAPIFFYVWEAPPIDFLGPIFLIFQFLKFC